MVDFYKLNYHGTFWQGQFRPHSFQTQFLWNCKARDPMPFRSFTRLLKWLLTWARHWRAGRCVLFPLQDIACFEWCCHFVEFPTLQLFASGGQRIVASASTLPVNIQGWFPLGLTSLISLESKGFSRIFCNIRVQKKINILLILVKIHIFTNTLENI